MKYFIVVIFLIALACASSDEFGYGGYRVEENEDIFNDIMGMHYRAFIYMLFNTIIAICVICLFFLGDDFRVGALVPLSGHASHVGKIVLESFIKSSQDLSHSCKGTCRTPIVRRYNTHSDPASAVQGFKEMYEEGVKVFIGLVTSAEAEAVARYASMYAKDAILISPASTATSLCKYKQLHRLSMDDRGYAQVLFDLAFDAKTKNARELPIQMILRNDAHGKGLFNDVRQKFQSKDGFKVLNPIVYNTNVLTSSHLGQLVNQLNASLARKERSIIVFSGYGEVEGIIQTAARNPNLLRHLWLFSDSLTLSNIETPENVDIFGLSFAGKYDSDANAKKEHELRHYLCPKGLPLTKHALLAYDTMIVAHNCLMRKSLSSFQSGETLTGAIRFSSCNERLSGSYAFAIAPREQKIDNLLIKVIMNKWIIRSYYNVKQNERQILASQYEELDTDAKIEADLQSSTKKSVTATDPPVIEIKKKDLLKVLVDIGDKRCTQTAQMTTTTMEALLDETCSQTTLSYKVTEMPEVIIFSDQLGFSMKVTCSSANRTYTLTRVCPSSKSPDTELVCTDKVSSRAIGMVEEEDLCTGSKVGTGVCYTGAAGCWVSTFFTWGVSAPACSVVTAGCGALSVGSYLICR